MISSDATSWDLGTGRISLRQKGGLCILTGASEPLIHFQPSVSTSSRDRSLRVLLVSSSYDQQVWSFLESYLQVRSTMVLSALGLVSSARIHKPHWVTGEFESRLHQHTYLLVV